MKILHYAAAAFVAASVAAVSLMTPAIATPDPDYDPARLPPGTIAGEEYYGRWVRIDREEVRIDREEIVPAEQSNNPYKDWRDIEVYPCIEEVRGREPVRALCVRAIVPALKGEPVPTCGRALFNLANDHKFWSAPRAGKFMQSTITIDIEQRAQEAAAKRRLARLAPPTLTIILGNTPGFNTKTPRRWASMPIIAARYERIAPVSICGRDPRLIAG